MNSEGTLKAQPPGAAAWKRWVGRAVLVLLCLISLEVASQLAFRLYKGAWYWKLRQASAPGMRQIHPYFGHCLTANASSTVGGVKITHNSFRCRGPEFARPKPPGLKRIVALGGSTTYCVGVSDDQTWEHDLAQELGAPYEVINMGGTGGTSLETMIQSAVLFSDVQPDIALYYLGWNDAHVQHVKDLWPDWSDYHGKSIMSMGLAGTELRERTATGYLLKRMAFHYFFPGLDPDRIRKDTHGTADALTDRIDQRALGHYVRNLRNIIAICRTQGVRPVFIPQVLNYDVLTSDKPYGFLPFVRDKDLKKVMGVYNETLMTVAREEGVDFVSEALDQHYTASDFIDNGHFSASGNQHFAHLLAAHLGKLLQSDTSSAAPASQSKGPWKTKD